VILIVHLPKNSNDPIKASLMHYGDWSSPHLLKIEIDNLINNFSDNFVVDNCKIFIYRQLARKHVWSGQETKVMLMKMIEMYVDKNNYTIIDLEPDKNDNNIGFVGFKFNNLNKIRSIKSDDQLNSFILKQMVLLSRTQRDDFVHKNPFYLVRHPNEFYLRCSRAMPILGLETKTFSLFTDKTPVIFDKSHWVNIDEHIFETEINKFMIQFKTEKNTRFFDVMVACASLYREAYPEKENSPHTPGVITAMVTAEHMSK